MCVWVCVWLLRLLARLDPPGFLLGQTQDILPLLWRDGRDAEPGLSQGLQGTQGPVRPGLGFEVVERDDGREFVAEGDVDEIPLGIILCGFFVVVGVGGI